MVGHAEYISKAWLRRDLYTWCIENIFLALNDNSDPQDFLNPRAMTVQKLVKHRLDEKSQ